MTTNKLTVREGERKHLRHYAKSVSIRLGDLRAVLDNFHLELPTLRGHHESGRFHVSARVAAKTIRDRAMKRGGRCTHDESRRRAEAARDELNRPGGYLDQRSKWQNRRDFRERWHRGADQAIGGCAEFPALPLGRRKERMANSLRARCWPGGYYSGETDWELHMCSQDQLGDASTVLEDGGDYSRSCPYSRTDATHHIYICLSHLIAAHRCGWTAIDGDLVTAAKEVRRDIWEVRLLTTVGKRAVARTRYAARQGDGQVHLARTVRGAVTALNRAARVDAEERLGQITGDVCRRWGWCASGVRIWCERHGIKRNTASRIRRGAKSHALARLIEKHGGASSAYERRIVLAAS